MLFLKTLGLSAVLSLSLNAFAFEPQEVCMAVNCTPAMKAVADSFVTTSPLVTAEGVVYSGACSYISGSTPAEYTHAGLAVFTPNNGVIEYRGLFSFYGKPSDYAGLSFEAATQRLGSRTKPANILTDLKNYSGFQSRKDGVSLHYWFGLSADQSKMSLLSVWVFDGALGQVAFCSFDRH